MGHARWEGALAGSVTGRCYGLSIRNFSAWHLSWFSGFAMASSVQDRSISNGVSGCPFGDRLFSAPAMPWRPPGGRFFAILGIFFRLHRRPWAAFERRRFMRRSGGSGFLAFSSKKWPWGVSTAWPAQKITGLQNLQTDTRFVAPGPPCEAWRSMVTPTDQARSREGSRAGTRERKKGRGDLRPKGAEGARSARETLRPEEKKSGDFLSYVSPRSIPACA